MFQIANLYELMGDMSQAVEWYFQVSLLLMDLTYPLSSTSLSCQQVIGLVPTDPAVLQKMGTIYDAEGDKQQAYQYHFDSYRCLRLLSVSCDKTAHFLGFFHL